MQNLRLQPFKTNKPLALNQFKIKLYSFFVNAIPPACQHSKQLLVMNFTFKTQGIQVQLFFTFMYTTVPQQLHPTPPKEKVILVKTTGKYFQAITSNHRSYSLFCLKSKRRGTEALVQHVRLLPCTWLNQVQSLVSYIVP